VTLRTELFLIAVTLFLAVLIFIAVKSYRRARRSQERDWERILSRLTAVDGSSIAEVALDVIDESGQPRSDEGSASLDPEQIWNLVGGLKGLEVLESNCEVLIDLAFFIQRWYPDALVVAEQLRAGAREIGWHVERLKGAQQTGKLGSSFAMYAQRAVAAYYLMTQRVLDLYEQGNSVMFDQLRRTL
jgi:hypothetical protein